MRQQRNISLWYLVLVVATTATTFRPGVVSFERVVNSDPNKPAFVEEELPGTGVAEDGLRNPSSKDVYYVLNSTEVSRDNPLSVNFGDTDGGSSATTFPTVEDVCRSDSDGEEYTCEELPEEVVCATVQDLDCWRSKVTLASPIALRIRNIQDGALPLALLKGLPIKSLDLTDANLRSFDLEDEDLVALPLLESLQLGRNPRFHLEDLKKLQRTIVKNLDLSGGTAGKRAKGLRAINAFPGLKDLHLEKNELISLSPELLPNELERLYVQRNNLIELKLHEDLAYGLRVLNASHSYLESFEIIPPKERRSSASRRRQPRLQTLDLSHNELPFLRREVVRLLENTNNFHLNNNSWDGQQCSLFHLHKWLKERKYSPMVIPNFDPKSLSRCSWDECPEECSCDESTLTVDCKAAELFEVPEIGPSEARKLILDKNQLMNLRGIESRAWCKVRTLSANSNRLSVLIPPQVKWRCRCPEEGFEEETEDCSPNIINISIAGNSIKRFGKGDVTFISHARRLDISDNALKTMGNSKESPSLKYLELTELDASDNFIDTIQSDDLRHYPYLKFLNLSRNSLSTFPNFPYPFSQSLETLDVSYNKIQKVPDNEDNRGSVFPNQPNIEELYIGNNHLQNLSSLFSIIFKSLRVLGLKNNPWLCSCDHLNHFSTQLKKRGLNKNSALLEALRSTDCPDGSYPMKMLSDILDDIRRLQTCSKSWGINEKDAIYVAIIFFAIIVGFIFMVQIFSYLKKREECPQIPPDTTYVACHRRDQWTLEELIPTLEEKGHSVEYLSQNAEPSFSYGEWRRRMRQCKQMLVILTHDFVCDSNYHQLLREGFARQNDHQHDFRVFLIVRNTEIIQRLPSDILQRMGLICLQGNGSSIDEVIQRMGTPTPIMDIDSDTTSVMREKLIQMWDLEETQGDLRGIQNWPTSGSLPSTLHRARRPYIFTYNTIGSPQNSNRPQLSSQSFQSQNEWGIVGVESSNMENTMSLYDHLIRSSPSTSNPFSSSPYTSPFTFNFSTMPSTSTAETTIMTSAEVHPLPLDFLEEGETSHGATANVLVTNL